MRRAFSGLARLTTAAWVVGVTACAPPAVSTARQAIVGGTADTGDPAVMMLIVHPVGSASLGLCTASLVSPHLLLTAAHCVDPVTFQSDMGAPPTLELYVDPAAAVTIGSTLDLSTLLTVRTSFFDPAFSSDPAVFATVGHDLGAVVLDQAQTIPPLPYNTTAITSSLDGEAARIIGYGIDSGTDTTGASAGTKRQADITIQSIDSLFVSFSDDRHATCEGDSGGPALYPLSPGTETIIGITAFGEAGCPVTSPSEDTRIDVYADEIAGWITAAEGAPDGGTTTSTGGPPATQGSTSTPAMQAGCATSGAATMPWAIGLVLVLIGWRARRRPLARCGSRPTTW